MTAAVVSLTPPLSDVTVRVSHSLLLSRKHSYDTRQRHSFYDAKSVRLPSNMDEPAARPVRHQCSYLNTPYCVNGPHEVMAGSSTTRARTQAAVTSANDETRQKHVTLSDKCRSLTRQKHMFRSACIHHNTVLEEVCSCRSERTAA